MNAPSPTARLIRLRQKLDLSQREIAKEFRVSPGAVGFWESGARPIPGPIIKLIAAYEYHLNPADQGSVERPKIEQSSRQLAEAFLSSVPGHRGRKEVASLHTTISGLLSLYLKKHL